MGFGEVLVDLNTLSDFKPVSSQNELIQSEPHILTPYANWTLSSPYDLLYSLWQIWYKFAVEYCILHWRAGFEKIPGIQSSLQFRNHRSGTTKTTTKKVRRANVQTVHMIYIYHTNRTSLQSSPLHNNYKVWATSWHLTTQWLHKFWLTHYPVTMNEGQGHSNWYQIVNCGGVSHCTKFERNWLVTIQLQAKVKYTKSPK